MLNGRSLNLETAGSPKRGIGQTAIYAAITVQIFYDHVVSNAEATAKVVCTNGRLQQFTITHISDHL